MCPPRGQCLKCLGGRKKAWVQCQILPASVWGVFTLLLTLLSLESVEGTAGGRSGGVALSEGSDSLCNLGQNSFLKQSEANFFSSLVPQFPSLSNGYGNISCFGGVASYLALNRGWLCADELEGGPGLWGLFPPVSAEQEILILVISWVHDLSSVPQFLRLWNRDIIMPTPWGLPKGLRSSCGHLSIVSTSNRHPMNDYWKMGNKLGFTWARSKEARQYFSYLKRKETSRNIGLSFVCLLLKPFLLWHITFRNAGQIAQARVASSPVAWWGSFQPLCPEFGTGNQGHSGFVC